MLGLFFVIEFIQQGLRGETAHFKKWLAEGRQSRIVKSGGVDVVKSKNRNICRNTQARFLRD